MSDSKTCPSCNKTKSFDDFGKNKKNKDGHRWCCKECDNKLAKEYYHSNLDKCHKRGKAWREKKKITDPYYFVLRAHQALAKQLDIPINDFENWYKKQWMKQQAQCAICGCVIVDEHIDHDHSKMGIKALRGILCHNDNTALGHVKDDINRLEKMIEYLKNNI